MRKSTDVLVIGLGPTGSVLAALLAEHGVRVIAVERDAEVYRLPRAAHFDAEILRVLQRLGVAEAVLAEARPLKAYEFRNGEGEILLRFEFAHALAPSGWAPSYLFHQPTMDCALRARLAELPEVETMLGASVVDVRQDGERVTARVDRGGETLTIDARFAVACDGAGSATRRALGIDLFDYGFDEPWLVVDTVVEDESRLPSYGVQVCDPSRPTTIMPMSHGRRRWEFMMKPGEEADAMLDDARITELLEPWSRLTPIQLVRKAVYRFHGLVAKSWRSGRVLLAGDAAHQMPPFAGQGMCSGIRDAANLAWKLALVLAGDADADLLDTYQTEREPHVRAIIELAIGMGRVVCTLDPEAASARDLEMSAQYRATAKDGVVPPPQPGIGPGLRVPSQASGEIFPQPLASSRSGAIERRDGLLAKGFCLVTRTAERLELPRYVGVANAAELGESTSRWLDGLGVESALVRPDRYVFGTGAPRELVAELERRLAAGRN
jgi:3-(3-hydroxy-phenyl)propionate hydroxylase